MTRQPQGGELSQEDIQFVRQMRRDWEGSRRIGCWGWRLFLGLGAAGAAIAGLIAGIKAIGAFFAGHAS